MHQCYLQRNLLLLLPLINYSTIHPTCARTGRHPERRTTVARRPLFGLSRLLFGLPSFQLYEKSFCSIGALFPLPQRDRPWLTAPLSHSRVKTCARRTSDWGNYPCWDIRGHVSRSQWGTGRQQMQNKSYRNYTFQLSIERYCSSIMLGEKGWKTSPQRPSMPRSKENKWGAP